MTRTLLAPSPSPRSSPAARSRSRSPPKHDLPPGSATAAQNELLEHWWTAFNDPVLTALIDEAFANNLDLAPRSPASRPRARRCCSRSRT